VTEVRKRRRGLIFVVAALVLVAAAGLAYWQRGAIALAMMERAMARNIGADAIADLPDGLHVVLCGAGSPMPDPTRAGPCTAVIAGDRLFVVDIGAGATRNLTLMGLPPARAEALLLTHFHSDHIDGLGEFMLQHWAAGSATAPLPVRGPEGVDSIVAGFNAAYTLDRDYRIAHHGETVTPPAGFGGQAQPFSAPGPEGQVILDDQGLRITVFPVDHSPVEPAVGYRFDYKGRSVVLSGDTGVDAAVLDQARGADLLVHEALSADLVARQQRAAEAAGRENLAKILSDIPDYHTTPAAAAELAQEAGVDMLLLTHIVPPLALRALEGPFLGEAPKAFEGPIRVGRDGDMVSLDAEGGPPRLSRLRVLGR